jgi:hypothetical protein
LLIGLMISKSRIDNGAGRGCCWLIEGKRGDGGGFVTSEEVAEDCRGGWRPRRQPSPARVSGPHSPLRMPKPRMSSGGESMPSPMASPSAYANELALHHCRHHRRQSSATSSELEQERAVDEENSRVQAEPGSDAFDRSSSRMRASLFLWLQGRRRTADCSQPERRPSSAAVSTGSNSPLECPTPRSHKSAAGLLGTSQPSRLGLSLAEIDAGDSSEGFGMRNGE